MHRWQLLPSLSQTPELMKPTDCPLYWPAEFAQTTAMRCVALGDDRFNSTAQQLLSVRLRIISAVRQQIPGSFAWGSNSPAHRRHRINHGNQLLAVIFVGTSHFRHQRRTVQIDQQMVLRACFTAINRAGAGIGAPKKARMYEASAIKAAISKSPAARRSASNNSCNFCQTPALFQSRKRRQQVIPEPQFISAGRSSQAMPVLSTNKIPVRHARFDIAGRPGVPAARTGGNSGSILFQSSSVSKALAMSSSLTID